jgi:hypothetical protein
LLALALAFPRAAAAHDPFEVTTDARVLHDRIDLHVMMAASTLVAVCATQPTTGRRFEAKEFTARRAEFEACARRLYAITSAGRALQVRSVRVLLTVEEDFGAVITFPPATPGPLEFKALFAERLPSDMGGVVLTATSETSFLGQQLLNSETRVLRVTLAPTPVGGQQGAAAPSAVGAPGAPAETAPATGTAVSARPPRQDDPAAAKPPEPTATPVFSGYLRLGIEHILTGYDHLLFLLGLLAVCRRLRTILTIVTCFTLAHSLTLGLAALGVFALSSRVVEPLIAATIVFVGVENLMRGDEPRGRWLLAFAFGLIHGFGFASALAAVGLGKNGAPILLPLFGFNLGVEIGQAAVAAVLLPLLYKLRSFPSFARRGAPALSIAVSAIGVFWLVRRVIGA